MKKIVMCLTLALVFMTTACAAGSFWDFKKDEGESKVANRIAVFVLFVAFFVLVLGFSSFCV